MSSMAGSAHLLVAEELTQAAMVELDVDSKFLLPPPAAVSTRSHCCRRALSRAFLLGRS
jgi:hypothetical protein